MKLSHAMQGYWLDKELSLSPRTIATYKIVFRYLIDFLADDDIEHIKSNDIRRFLVWLRDERQVSRRTVHDYWIPLSSLWTWAEKELEIPHIIRGKVKQPDYTKTTIDPFTAEEVSRLIKATEHTAPWTTRYGKRTRSRRNTAERDKAILLTLVDTGMRASELCALTLADYDQKRGRFYVRHGKGDKERYVVAGKRTQKAIWRYLLGRDGAGADDPLFISETGKKINRKYLYQLVNRIGDRAGVSNAHPHRLRHTFAVTFLRNGGNVKTLQELLGHESLEMVMLYVKLAEQDIDGAVKHSPVDNWRI